MYCSLPRGDLFIAYGLPGASSIVEAHVANGPIADRDMCVNIGNAYVSGGYCAESHNWNVGVGFGAVEAQFGNQGVWVNPRISAAAGGGLTGSAAVTVRPNRVQKLGSAIRCHSGHTGFFIKNPVCPRSLSV